MPNWETISVVYLEPTLLLDNTVVKRPTLDIAELVVCDEGKSTG